MSIQFITFKNTISSKFPNKVLNIIKSYDQSHFSKKLQYHIMISIKFNNYRKMTEDKYIFALNEQSRLISYATNYASIEFTMEMFTYLLNSSYIFLGILIS